MSLKFDYNTFSNAFLGRFQINLEQVVLDMWEQDVLKETNRNKAVYQDQNIGTPLATAYAKRRSQEVVAYFEANPTVLASAFGTGSHMDIINNPAFGDYWKSSVINPARTSKTIVGRPKGRYTDAFGNKKSSKGTLEGQNIEGLKYRDKDTGEEVTIEPMDPDVMIQKMILLADTYLENYINIAIELTIENIDISDYIIEGEDK